MLRHVMAASPLLMVLFLVPCAAEDRIGDLPEPTACVAPKEDIGLRKEDERDWTPCEKWVWSCIREGKEANLHHKACVEPRSEESSQLRERDRYAAFYEPDRFKETNALSGAFLRKIMSDQDYEKQIPPPGIRIFGGYFKNLVILENISTAKNVVLDGSIFKKGVRLANFHVQRSLAFDNANIRGAMELFRTRIDGSLFLSDGVYDRIDMRDAAIASSIDADNSVFNDEFSLDRTRIGGNLNFEDARLTVLKAHGANIGGSLKMWRADIRVRMDLTGSRVDGDVYLQRLRFGRQGPMVNDAPRCDWAGRCKGREDMSCYDILRPSGENDKGDVVQKIRNETVRYTQVQLPGEDSKPADVCINNTVEQPFEPTNEVLLRDMNIKGTLCLLDISGEIADASKESASPYFVKRISLDGTEAKTTVLHLEDTESKTLWRAVNFKTSYILLTLPDKPPRHYMDNVDFGFIALANHVAEETVSGTGQHKADYAMCDLDPAPASAIPLGSREGHERIVRFFAGPTNMSPSSQPFAKMVERLHEAGVRSNYLTNALFDFQIPDVCTSSAFSRAWYKLAETDERWESETFWEKLSKSWAAEPGSDRGGWSGAVALEGGKFLLDGLCWRSSGGYKYVAFFRGNPFVGILVFDLICFSALMILFLWFLLLFDKSKLGLAYSIDMFHPFHRFRFNSAHSEVRPNSRVLRSYMRVHCLIGALSTVLLVVLIYFAAK